MVIVLCPSRAAIASRLMPRLMAWVASVCRSWWGWTCPMPATVPAGAGGVVEAGGGDGASAVGEEQRAVLPARAVGEPVIDHGLELWVQWNVAVVVQFAERDAQPVGRADLDHGVGGEAEQFSFAHAGAGQDLDGEPSERVLDATRGGHELHGRCVVEEPREWLVFDGPVGGEHR